MALLGLSHLVLKLQYKLRRDQKLGHIQLQHGPHLAHGEQECGELLNRKLDRKQEGWRHPEVRTSLQRQQLPGSSQAQLLQSLLCRLLLEHVWPSSYSFPDLIVLNLVK
jgi:hypothetical protein